MPLYSFLKEYDFSGKKVIPFMTNGGWPVDGFVKANDFTGKTVIPFCTAASSGIGGSGKLLEDMAGTGDWKERERFHGGASEADVTEWVDSQGLGK